MVKAVLCAWLCLATCALMTLAISRVTTFDAVSVGLLVSGSVVLVLWGVDRHRAMRREMTFKDPRQR